MRTEENLKIICDDLQTNCGDLHKAARAAGMSPAMLFRWIRDDKEAAERIDEAQRVGWAMLESEAIRRAVQGVDKDVYFQGDVVGTETVYSDRLLVKVLEARVDAYAKKSEGGASFHGPTQINIMPRAENYEAWLEMKKVTLEQRAQEALPAPDVKIPDILQGEYVEYETVPAQNECLKGLL